MSLQLKIKSKHLAIEASIIRHEERKLKRQANWKKEHQPENTAEIEAIRAEWFSLNGHRRFDVRNENRATYLARAFIAGSSYVSTENTRKEDKEAKFIQFVIPRTVQLVKKYFNSNMDATHIEAWINKIA